MYGHINPTVRTTEQGEQVGPKMHSALKVIQQYGPAASKNRLAKLVGPNGSQDYGYRIVDRCSRKDLLFIHPSHDTATPNGKGAVVLTDKGARYLNEHEDADLEPDEFIDADTYRFEVRE
jgi:hypothetical protein